jgi:hypothetical protein
MGEEARGLALALSSGGYRALCGKLAFAPNKGSAGPYLIQPGQPLKCGRTKGRAYITIDREVSGKRGCSRFEP